VTAVVGGHPGGDTVAEWTWLGRVPYGSALHLQEQMRNEILAGQRRDTLLLLEHPAVITLGRHANPAHVLLSIAALRSRGIDVCQTDRGGDVTFHGPGQLVGYPIFRLRRGVRAHVQAMATSIVEWLAALGLVAEWRASNPGVWLGNEKICALGVHVRHRIATHGFAFNLATDLDGFSTIIPCGLPTAGVTSLLRQMGSAAPPEVVARSLIGLFEKNFGVQLVEVRVPGCNRPAPVTRMMEAS
jgi:lipoyl(octanoyl) transferase